MVSAVEQEIRRLEAIRAEVQGVEQNGRKPRTLSAEGRRKIAEAQHRRWARARAAKEERVGSGRTARGGTTFLARSYGARSVSSPPAPRSGRRNRSVRVAASYCGPESGLPSRAALACAEGQSYTTTSTSLHHGA